MSYFLAILSTATCDIPVASPIVRSECSDRARRIASSRRSVQTRTCSAASAASASGSVKELAHRHREVLLRDVADDTVGQEVDWFPVPFGRSDALVLTAPSGAVAGTPGLASDGRAPEGLVDESAVVRVRHAVTVNLVNSPVNIVNGGVA